MADDEEKTTMEAGEDTVLPEETKAPSPGGKKKLIMFAGVGLVAVVVAVAVAMFVIKPMMADDAGAENADAQVESAQHDGGAKEAKKAHQPARKKSHGDEGEQSSIIYAIQDIVVNPAGTGGSRFLSVSFGFELESSYLEAEFETREVVIRDALITILSAKTVAQLTDPRQKEITRYQIKKRVASLLDTDELGGVYFTDFVLQ